MIKAIIVEDEKKNVMILQALLEDNSPGVKVVATASNAVEAFDLITQHNPELVFLDIEIPFGNAFDLLEKLKPIHFEVIFVTAYHHYAVQAFKYNSIDYLLKPINETDLKDAVSRAEDRIRNKPIVNNLHKFLADFKQSASNKIGLPTSDGYIFIYENEIMRCKADGSYTEVHLKDGSKQIICKNLKEFEKLLNPESFCRVHHSHIININFVKKYYRGNGGYLELEDGTSIEISVRKKGAFFDKYKL